jgi:hypothetical protein
LKRERKDGFPVEKVIVFPQYDVTGTAFPARKTGYKNKKKKGSIKRGNKRIQGEKIISGFSY